MKMAFAIFWLPLIAGLLLGGLAVGAWYGGDKTLAIWVGFIGALCLLLTAALQLQQFVWGVANQPQITLEPDGSASWYVRWNPPSWMGIEINSDPNAKAGAWKVPGLILRNRGVVAQDATIKWGVTPFDREAMVKSAPRLSDVEATFPDKDQLLLRPKAGGQSFVHEFTWATSLPLPFIGRETQTYIPLHIWQNASLFFLATTPDRPDAVSEPFYFDAQVSWNIPDGGAPVRFRVAARARNVGLPTPGAPKFLAKIELSVSPEP